MGYKAALLSLGCKVNSYETERIRENLVEKQFEIVDFESKADVYIVNTCSVTNIADRKSRQMLHKARALNPESIIVATGCYVQTEKDNVRLKESADIIVGNNHKGEIAEIIISYLQERADTCFVDDISCEKKIESFSINDYPERNRAFVRIEDGCDQFCSYCIIPYARGRVRSRSETEIVEEVKELAARGFKEVVLTGIHISSYGVDNYERSIKENKAENDEFDSSPLLKLIDKISKIQEIKRIRLSSLEPRIITRSFLMGLKEIASFCPHFHLSLQSGCDTVLKRMNRHYTSEEFLERCSLIREFFDRAAITTDVIVGFPSETESEFEESYDFCRKAAFAKMHIFKYSRRKGTVADRMGGQLTEKEKHSRSIKLQSLDERMQEEYLRSFIGDTVSVLVEEEGNGCCQGLTERYVQVRFSTDILYDPKKAECIGNKKICKRLINTIVQVRITGMIEKGVLFGEYQQDIRSLSVCPD